MKTFCLQKQQQKSFNIILLNTIKLKNNKLNCKYKIKINVVINENDS